MTVSQFLDQTLNYKESFYPYCALIMVGRRGQASRAAWPVARGTWPGASRAAWPVACAR